MKRYAKFTVRRRESASHRISLLFPRINECHSFLAVGGRNGSGRAGVSRRWGRRLDRVEESGEPVTVLFSESPRYSEHNARYPTRLFRGYIVSVLRRSARVWKCCNHLKRICAGGHRHREKARALYAISSLDAIFILRRSREILFNNSRYQR